MALIIFSLFWGVLCNFDLLQGFACFSFIAHLVRFLKNVERQEDCGEAARNPDEDVPAQESTDEGPQEDAVEDDEETAWDRKPLSRTDPACAQDHNKLNDGLRTSFCE